MVADEPAAVKWQPNSCTTPRYNNIYGCFKKGLGCDLQQCQNEWKMVFSGEPVHINLLELKGALLAVQSLLY